MRQISPFKGRLYGLALLLFFGLLRFGLEADAAGPIGWTVPGGSNALFPGDAVVQGNITIGNGTPTVTQDGEDLYVEGTLEVGGAVTFAAAGGFAMANGESINTGADGIFDFTRNTAGTVTLTASDDNAVAALTVLPGGAAAMVLGGASTTGITLTTDGGSVVVDGTLGGVAPAGITATPAAGTWVFTRDDAGIGTISCADTDATAGCTYDAGGASPIVIGSADVTSLTVTTDGTGTGEVVLPTGAIATGEILDGTILPADEAFAGRASFTVCGDLVTIADATPVFYGPSMALVESATVGLARTCNTAATGNVTEGTADEPAFTATAFQVLSMDCIVQDVNITSVVFAARSAAAATTPSVTCTVLDGELGCLADVQTTTAIASGATFAVSATGSGADVGDVQFICTVHVAI